MAPKTFANALQLAVSGKLPLPELIEAASNLCQSNQATLARQLYRSWINLNREHPLLYVAYFNCSTLDSDAQDFAAATDSLDKAIALNPEFAPAYINLGRLW